MSPAKSSSAFSKASIHLEGWGMSAQDVTAVSARLNLLLPHIHWHADEVADQESLRLLLVDVAALTGEKGQAFWNAFGPIQSMARARQAEVPALALCRGGISELPMLREGVWIPANAESWENKILAVVGALAAMEWNATGGYRSMAGWQATRELARSNLLAISASDDEEADFSALLRQISSASIAHPAALSVAGVDIRTFEHTLTQAGLHDIPLLAAAPMTLDGAVRVDVLVGFTWPGTSQFSSSSAKRPRE